MIPFHLAAPTRKVLLDKHVSVAPVGWLIACFAYRKSFAFAMRLRTWGLDFRVICRQKD